MVVLGRELTFSLSQIGSPFYTIPTAYISNFPICQNNKQMRYMRYFTKQMRIYDKLVEQSMTNHDKKVKLVGQSMTNHSR